MVDNNKKLISSSMLNNLPKSISIDWLYLTNNFKLELLGRMEQEPNTPTAESPTSTRPENIQSTKTQPICNALRKSIQDSSRKPAVLFQPICQREGSALFYFTMRQSPLEIDYLITLCSVNPCFPGPVTFRRASQYWSRESPNNNHYSRICILLLFTLAAGPWRAEANNQTVLLSLEESYPLVLFTSKL